jgi:hypothetical protein
MYTKRGTTHETLIVRHAWKSTLPRNTCLMRRTPLSAEKKADILTELSLPFGYRRSLHLIEAETPQVIPD